MDLTRLINNMRFHTFFKKFQVLVLVMTGIISQAQEPIKYNNEGLVTDLGVGLWAWPLPMDWDQDGDLDLIVSCPDTPYNGTFFFENKNGDAKMPVFKKAKRIGKGLKNIQISYVNGEPKVLMESSEFLNFLGKGFKEQKKLSHPNINVGEGRVRAKQWKYVDYDGNGLQDLIFGAGFWGDYGWDNAFNEKGEWQRGPLHGYIYVFSNTGSNDEPEYGTPFRVQSDGKDLDVYGMPSPNFNDFDRDGDLDILCGEFLDGFTYFKNIGSRTNPIYEKGIYLKNDGNKLSMHVQMITPVTIDWDKDGDIDIICGDEDGRVAFIENTGNLDRGIPKFENPVYFQQEADDVKFGALVTPFSIDWDNDGDEDIIAGNTSGNICFIENLKKGDKPIWAKPVLLEAGNKTIHIQAGYNGSIQGPAEAKWGYTVLNVADWDHDGLLDIVVNSIFGKVVWYKNIGKLGDPKLAKSKPIEVEWSGTPPKPAWNWSSPKKKEFVTQWRTTPCVIDWNKDGLNDLIMLDYEGYLSFFERVKRGKVYLLLPGKRIFRGGIFTNKKEILSDNNTLPKDIFLRLNSDEAGASGRRKFCFSDWDGDGDLDLLVNSKNVSMLENVETDKEGVTTFVNRGLLCKKKLAGHTTSPTTVDWDKNGIPDLLIGAEDGRLYYFKNPRDK